MNSLRIIVIVCLLTCTAMSQDRQSQPSLRESLKQPWKTLKIGLIIDQGDAMSSGPCLMLQRLDSQVVLSVVEAGGSAERSLPVALAVITEDAAKQLVETALSFYTEAQKETGEKARVAALPSGERTAIQEKFKFGMYADYITFDLIGPDLNRSYSDDFNESTETSHRFYKFLQERTKTK